MQVGNLLTREKTRLELESYYSGDAACIEFFEKIEMDNKHELKNWMEDCLRSLYFKPNHTVAVFRDEYPDLFRCLPREFSKRYDVYEKSEFKQMCSDVMSDNFIVLNPYTEDVTTDKRLANYYSAQETWGGKIEFPQRKDIVHFHIRYFDEDIDMLSVWASLYKDLKI